MSAADVDALIHDWLLAILAASYVKQAQRELAGNCRVVTWARRGN